MTAHTKGEVSYEVLLRVRVSAGIDERHLEALATELQEFVEDGERQCVVEGSDFRLADPVPSAQMADGSHLEVGESFGSWVIFQASPSGSARIGLPFHFKSETDARRAASGIGRILGFEVHSEGVRK